MFFQNFPLVEYDLNDNESILVTNILKRFRIRRSVIEDSSFYYNYQLQDNEAPEVLAHKFYGRSDLHWLILLTNDIRDPYRDWPRHQQVLEKLVEKKYPGTSLFLWNADLITEKGDRVEPHVSHFNIGDEIEWLDVENANPDPDGVPEYEYIESGVTATVLDWDPQYMKLVISDSVDWPENKYIANNTKGIAVVGYVLKSVALSSEAIHHWEDQDGLHVNPLDLDRSNANDADNPEESAGRRYRDAYMLGETEVEYTLDYPPKDYILKAITNTQHEINENEKKRNIKIIKPDFVEDILSDFKEVFK